MKKVKGGPFVTELLETMREKANRILSPDRNIYVYSGHDTTLVNIIRALEIYDQTDPLPNFGSSLNFELHKRNDFNEHEIKVRF